MSLMRFSTIGCGCRLPSAWSRSQHHGALGLVSEISKSLPWDCTSTSDIHIRMVLLPHKDDHHRAKPLSAWGPRLALCLLDSWSRGQPSRHSYRAVLNNGAPELAQLTQRQLARIAKSSFRMCLIGVSHIRSLTTIVGLAPCDVAEIYKTAFYNHDRLQVLICQSSTRACLSSDREKSRYVGRHLEHRIPVWPVLHLLCQQGTS
ncbi:hypothetical protein BKA63DRAFT_315980 [Paraphoma chrysanthemicola]|nr:hypothetical protein BKA63DRAFT_315980 [Paraphoma chrysanthemicola]